MWIFPHQVSSPEYQKFEKNYEFMKICFLHSAVTNVACSEFQLWWQNGVTVSTNWAFGLVTWHIPQDHCNNEPSIIFYYSENSIHLNGSGICLMFDRGSVLSLCTSCRLRSNTVQHFPRILSPVQIITSLNHCLDAVSNNKINSCF